MFGSRGLPSSDRFLEDTKTVVDFSYRFGVLSFASFDLLGKLGDVQDNVNIVMARLLDLGFCSTDRAGGSSRMRRFLD